MFEQPSLISKIAKWVIVSVVSIWALSSAVQLIGVLTFDPSPEVSVTEYPANQEVPRDPYNLEYLLQEKRSDWFKDDELASDWGSDEFYIATAEMGGGCHLLVFDIGTPRPEILPDNSLEDPDQWSGMWRGKFIVLRSFGIWEGATYFIADGADTPCAKEAASVLQWRFDDKGRLVN